MINILNDSEIDNILLSQSTGRIACSNNNLPYIVPVNYVFDGRNIICQTSEGRKMELMRKNPNVCFEVDISENNAFLQSVIIKGIFRELKGVDSDKARDYLYEHAWSLLPGKKVHLHEHNLSNNAAVAEDIKPLMIEIKVLNKTGRTIQQ